MQRNKQRVFTPKIMNCWCGQSARCDDWNEDWTYYVMCNANHTITKPCGSAHRAICLWNNRQQEILNETVQEL